MGQDACARVGDPPAGVNVQDRLEQVWGWQVNAAAELDTWDEITKEIPFVPSSELAARTWKRLAELQRLEDEARKRADEEEGDHGQR